MRVALILAALLLAAPAHAKPWVCVLFPKQCIEPTVAPEPAPVPPPEVRPAPELVRPVAPVITPAPVQPAAPVIIVPVAPRHAAKPHHKPAVKPPRVKSKFARPKRVALPSWCDRIPAGTTMGRVESVAPLFIGRPITASERAQALACLASK